MLRVLNCNRFPKHQKGALGHDGFRKHAAFFFNRKRVSAQIFPTLSRLNGDQFFDRMGKKRVLPFDALHLFQAARRCNCFVSVSGHSASLSPGPSESLAPVSL